MLRSLLNRVVFAMLGVGVTAVAHTAVTCSVTPSVVAFGNYDPSLIAHDDSTGTVAVTCSLTKPETVVVGFTLSMNQGASGVYSSRSLKAGASILTYNIFTDTSRLSIWGDGTGGSTVVNGSVELGHGVGKNGTETATYTSYGRVPAGQDVVPGTYADVLTVTVTW